MTADADAADEAPARVAPMPIRMDAEVVENRRQSETGCRIRLRLADWPGFQPGQFAMLSAGALLAAPRFDPLLPRPMAIYREHPCQQPGFGEIEFLCKVVGRGTALLAEASPGQRLRFVGPLGRGFPVPEPGAGAVLVGGGTGIASLYALAAAAQSRGPVVVLLGAGSKGDLMGASDFEALGVDLRLATEDGSAGQRGFVTELLEPLLAADGVGRVYACGPTPMMARCAELAASAGVPCSVSLENVMACGFGVCLGCAAPVVEGGYQLVCSAGPVFEAERVLWRALP